MLITQFLTLPLRLPSLAMTKVTAFMLMLRQDAKLGISAMLTENGHFYVQMEPFSTKRFSLAFGGSTLNVRQLNSFMA